MLNSASLYSSFLGETEKYIRNIFHRARQAAPAIIFMDEIDTLVGKRDVETGSGGVEKRVLSTLLNEMDGIEMAKEILVIAATNRPDMIDAALLRPGRLDHLIYVPLPDTEARLDILKIHTRHFAQQTEEWQTMLMQVAKLAQRYSGAELEGVCREAALQALREDIATTSVQFSHFLHALNTIKANTSMDTLLFYEAFQNKQ